MTRERLQKIVGELESIQIQGDAVARLQRRRRELGLVGNRVALMKLGTEMLKAATAGGEKAQETVAADTAATTPLAGKSRLAGLFCPSSDASIDDVAISDELQPACPVESSRRRYLKAFVPTVMASLVISFFALFGARTLVTDAAETYLIPQVMKAQDFGPTMNVAETAAAETAAGQLAQGN